MATGSANPGEKLQDGASKSPATQKKLSDCASTSPATQKKAVGDPSKLTQDQQKESNIMKQKVQKPSSHPEVKQAFEKANLVLHGRDSNKESELSKDHTFHLEAGKDHKHKTESVEVKAKGVSSDNFLKEKHKNAADKATGQKDKSGEQKDKSAGLLKDKPSEQKDKSTGQKDKSAANVTKQPKSE